MTAQQISQEDFMSPTIDVIAGDERRVYYVHESKLAKSGSPSLQALLKTDWKECQERIIDWTNVNSATVHRVLQYLYNQDYNVPTPVERLQASHDSTDPLKLHSGEEAKGEYPLPRGYYSDEEDFPEANVRAVQKFQSNAAHIKEGPLTPILQCIGADLKPALLDRKTAAGAFHDLSLPYANFCYKALLMAHAEVYEFATYHMLEELRFLALQRQQMVLERIDCSLAYAVEDIAELAAYVYANTPESTAEPSMRHLVSQFIALNAAALLKDGFNALLTQGGDFVLDLVSKLSRQLRHYGPAASKGSLPSKQNKKRQHYY
ncbi:hypothetical protein K461DRAFT_298175 [Myriangium duriaei CBS 260.36]|uniref:BTB domain-containing protein n=1 Tax=Myriangium duriaei CBS 260.36 TaxID=1168546 RepID=A0A9P4MFM6_9PEZI|nr:hypothetical protein K461DRAFT_298175 [Myriangium duriaei CBS 260.36]